MEGGIRTKGPCCPAELRAPAAIHGVGRPPLSILLQQRITIQEVQVGEGNIQNFSDTKLDMQNVSDTTLDVPIDHSEASHDKPKSTGGSNGSPTTLFFTDGIDGETHGLFGAISVPVPSPVLDCPA